MRAAFMTSKFFPVLILFLLTGTLATAQSKDWKKLQKEAQEFEKAGDLTRAAIYYESAFDQNKSNLDLAYKAGDCYLRIRDYANAVKNLEAVKGENANSSYTKPGFKYALALKQSGDYDKAKAAFKGFVSSYSGADKEAMTTRVEMEIQGCTFAATASKNVAGDISIVHLSPAVNSDKDDFAAIPLRGNELYFSSIVNNEPRVFYVQRKGDEWANRQEFDAGKKVKGAFANGTFTPDYRRFYFTKCEADAKGISRCALYFTEYENGNWSEPAKLPSYINPDGTSNTHPCVVVENEVEIIYYASDREGGKGGFDIWYTSRTVKSKGMNFTLPKNLGNNINSDADEITPFYDLNNETLFFSSNGHVSAGGLDVFKSKGAKTKWEVAQNMGFPINSPADDLYYVVSEEQGGGYFTSNRTFESEKVATSNDDIYYFGQRHVQLIVKGKIYDEKDASKEPLKDVNAKLFEIVNGVEELVQDRMLAVAEYKFNLDGNKKYLIEINADGFEQAVFEVVTYDIERSETRNNDIAMIVPGGEPPVVEKELIVIVPEEYDSPNNAYELPESPIDAYSGEEYEEGSKGYDEYMKADAIAQKSPLRKVYWAGTALKAVIPEEPEIVKVDTTKHVEPYNTEQEEEAPVGKCYIIQVAAVREYKAYKYKDLEKGQLSKYKISFEEIEMGIKRVLIVPKDANEDGTIGFKRKSDALNVLYHILNHSQFTRAFVIEYTEGKRSGDGFRGMEDEL